MRLGFYAAVCATLALVAVLSASSPAADGTTGRYFVAGKLPANVTPIADYGDRVLVNLTADQAAKLKAAGADVEPLADATLLKLNRATIDTSGALPAVPRGLASPPSPTSWIVQLVGPPAEGWLASLRKTGLRLVAHGYVPEHGWLVRAESPAIRRALKLSFVQAAIPFHPAYRISPRLDALSGALEVRVLLFDDVDLGAWAGKIADLGATELGRIDDKDVKLLRLRINAALVPALARLDAVQWIEPALELELTNDRAADTLNVRPVWAGLNGVPGLEGQGEVVAVADTGLDNGNIATIHPDFAGRVKQLQAWGRPGPGGDIYNGDASDPSFDAGGTHGVGGHGTHTSGSVLGNGAAWGTVNLTGCTASCMSTTPPKGMAPRAELVMQSISGPDFGSLSGVPEDPGDLYGAAYAEGARVHSNSYGSASAGAYDGQAFLLDRFMETHPDMLITFSAGNSGTDGDANGIIDFGSIGSPATAKDTLAVGASEDNRGAGFTSGRFFGVDQGDVPLYTTYAVFLNAPAPPIVDDLMSNNEEGMVAFSSRGPTQDGRIKPEVVGIGTHVLSTRSRIITTAGDDVEFHYWSLPQHGSSVGQPSRGDYPASTNAFYGFNGGTSMSNPLVAGTGALVRQYLRTQRGLGAPSAALIKAMMTAGAYELQGQYDPLHPDVTARPDNNEGWGRVDVASTVAPAAPTKIAVFDDPVGLRTGARAGYPLAVGQAGLPLRVQLAWTDIAGNLVAAKSLVNDLDVTLRAPDGTMYRGNQFGARANGTTPSTPNAAAGNHVDNLEGITVPSAAAGKWTVEIRGFTVPAAPQRYALVVRGALAGTPSGAIHFDALRYRSGGRPAQLVVNDPARNRPGVADTVTAKVTSETTPAGVVVTLTEDPNAEGVFTGSLAIGSTLPVSHEDHLRATYKDASGTTVKGFSNVDDVVPSIANQAVTGITPFGASIVFRTTEDAAGSVDMGATPASFGITSTDPALVRTRTVNVLGLDGAKRYYYRLRATDDAGNVGTDDNKGKQYTLRTSRSVVEYTYDAEAAAGWTHAVNPDNAAAAADEWHLTTRADAVHGGTSAWLFGPEDPNANHGANADAFLDSPTINRTAAQWATAEFWANYDTEKGFDGVNVLGSDDGGATYRLLPLVSIGPASGPELDSAQIDGNSGGYRLLTFDISSFSGPTFRLRLQFTSDGGVEKGGFAFDDLTVKASELAPVTASLGASPEAWSPSSDGFTRVGTVLLTPSTNWVRLETLVVRRTGTATDGDVPQIRLIVPGQAPVVASFVNGRAVLRSLVFDSSSGSPVAAVLEVKIAGGSGTGRTAGVVALKKGSVLAQPDTLAGGDATFPAKPL